LIQARQAANAVEMAAIAADKADAAVIACQCVTVRYTKAGKTSTRDYPAGTDVWDVLKKIDAWVKT